MKHNISNKNRIFKLMIYLIGITLFLPVLASPVFAGGEIGAWHETTPLPQAVNLHSCFTINGYAYCTGGYGSLQSIYFAQKNNDGTLGKWQAAANLPNPLQSHQCLAAGNYAYCLGGRTASGITNEVWYAPINQDGTLGAWEQTESLPNEVEKHQCVTLDNMIYCIGGNNGNSQAADVWYAKIKDGGSLGPWQVTTSLPVPVEQHKCFVANNYIYSAGGLSDARTNSVWYTQINQDGTLGTWQAASNLPQEIYSLQCVPVNGYVYCGGGRKILAEDLVWNALINDNGTLGQWQAATSLPKKISFHQGLAIGSTVYFMGGATDNEDEYRLNNVYFATVNPVALTSHPVPAKSYITDSLDFNISIPVQHGYYYLIDDSPDTLITPANGVYITENPAAISIAATHGTKYLHIALADSDFNVQPDTYHYSFNNIAAGPEVTSSTHPDQEQFYTLSNLSIKVANWTSGTQFRCIIDDNPGTIPDASSQLKNSGEFVFPGQGAGTHFLHIRAQDSDGELTPGNLTAHFQFNIHDSGQPAPAPLPIVKDLKITPEQVPSNQSISIQAIISVEQGVQ